MICLEYEIDKLEIEAEFIQGEPDVNIPDHWDIKSVKTENGTEILPELYSEDLDNIQEYLFNKL